MGLLIKHCIDSMGRSDTNAILYTTNKEDYNLTNEYRAGRISAETRSAIEGVLDFIDWTVKDKCAYL